MMSCNDGLIFASGAVAVGAMWYMQQSQYRGGYGMATECSARRADIASPASNVASARAANNDQPSFLEAEFETSTPITMDVKTPNQTGLSKAAKAMSQMQSGMFMNSNNNRETGFVPLIAGVSHESQELRRKRLYRKVHNDCMLPMTGAQDARASDEEE